MGALAAEAVWAGLTGLAVQEPPADVTAGDLWGSAAFFAQLADGRQEDEEEQLLPQHPPGTLKPVKKAIKEVVDELMKKIMAEREAAAAAEWQLDL